MREKWTEKKENFLVEAFTDEILGDRDIDHFMKRVRDYGIIATLGAISCKFGDLPSKKGSIFEEALQNIRNKNKDLSMRAARLACHSFGYQLRRRFDQIRGKNVRVPR